MTPAIVAHGLGKQYHVTQPIAYGMLRDVVARAVRAPWRLLRSGTDDDLMWVLRDVSFEIGEGEVVGIIGRNGSGKSTLLKILSRITDPSAGRATVRGRVGSLLEVGTGFHPELTGRENVFINGAMLGMRRRDIVRRFDEIVAFAGVERFIDTPVKHYSSGMQMRLAFAVAAHLEPQILLVDEVLAVGDAEFQRRCLGKMRDVSRQGRTVLLVSHQIGQIRRLCQKVLWLDRGRLREMGAAGPTIQAYESAVMSRQDPAGEGHGFLGWDLSDGSHVLTDGTRPCTLRVRLNLSRHVTNGHFSLGLHGSDDEVIAGWAFDGLLLDASCESLDVTLPQLPLRAGMYRWRFALFEGGNTVTGSLIERWAAVPELAIEVPSLGHLQDEHAGVLNLAASLVVTRVDGPHRADVAVVGRPG